MVKKTCGHAALCCLLFSFNTTAKETGFERIHIQDLAHGGTACPQGEIRANLSEDKNKLHVAFGKYQANSNDSRHGFVRKTCQFRISLYVPEDMQVELHKTDYIGHIRIHPKGVAGFTASHIFAGHPVGEYVEQTWQNLPEPLDTRFSLRQHLASEWSTVSACGESVFLQVSTSSFVSHPFDGQPTDMQLHHPTEHGAIYHLKWSNCRAF